MYYLLLIWAMLIISIFFVLPCLSFLMVIMIPIIIEIQHAIDSTVSEFQYIIIDEVDYPEIVQKLLEMVY